jgi:hypothetical protein
MNVESWDWSLRVNVEALYRDIGNVGHGVGPTLG